MLSSKKGRLSLNIELKILGYKLTKDLSPSGFF